LIESVSYLSTNQANSTFHPSVVDTCIVFHVNYMDYGGGDY